MYNRRKFIQTTAIGISAALANNTHAATASARSPIVISTWDAGLEANKAAWTILSNKGKYKTVKNSKAKSLIESTKLCV